MRKRGALTGEAAGGAALSLPLERDLRRSHWPYKPVPEGFLERGQAKLQPACWSQGVLRAVIWH